MISMRRAAPASGPQARQRAAALPDGGQKGSPALQDFGQFLPEMTMIMLKRYRKDTRRLILLKVPRSSGRGSGEPTLSDPGGSPMSETSEGQIVTFYSYKGGTGRTMAMANVAWILASNGKRVLAVDWDLESPGLHKFFHPVPGRVNRSPRRRASSRSSTTMHQPR
jgi:Mrp family chromosome partitioning ATPase